ncbi:hypothetical protein [Streptomyces sp. NPDC057966]|uniref:hypothetical protein n=1 Tax=Streptomyces sp. NPDC057966 TaxID=3346292 RepID=UPI0036E903EF
MDVSPPLVKGSGWRAKREAFLRGAGVAGGVFSTVYIGADVWAQGNPASHFGSRGSGAKYVADVAEVGLNASLTATTTVPNPFTIGAVAVTGSVWADAKVVEHWDDIEIGEKKAKDWVGHKTSEINSDISDEASDLAVNWF